MIKIEEYQGKLFRMLEEPVPLTPDAEMPCLVRLIQDDSPMGKHNKDLHGFDPERLTPRICTEVIDVNDLSDHNRGSIRYDGFVSCQYYHYELIGTPVVEGSAEWALYQMMQGNKVRHKSYVLPNTHCAMNEKCQIAIFTTPSSMIYRGYVVCHANDWLTSRHVDTMVDERTGWQLYEPEPEQPKSKPETLFDTWQCPVCGESISAEFEDSGHPRYNEEHLDENLCFAIGDHMKYSHPAEGVLRIPIGLGVKEFVRSYAKTGWQIYKEPKIEPPKEPDNLYLNIKPSNPVDWCFDKKNILVLVDDNFKGIVGENVTREQVVEIAKLLTEPAPKFVVVPIAISGTVRQAYNEDGTIDDEQFQLLPNGSWDGTEMFISFGALDTHTLELVESLLKAQEEEK